MCHTFSGALAASYCVCKVLQNTADQVLFEVEQEATNLALKIMSNLGLNTN